MIDGEELNSLNLATDNDKFFWFDRLTFTYQTEYEITYMVDECKSDSYDNGRVLGPVECPWAVLPYGYKIDADSDEFLAVAYRPTNGLPNSINTGFYNVYASWAIKDRVTKEVLRSGGPEVKEINLGFEDTFASAGLATASALFLAFFAF